MDLVGRCRLIEEGRADDAAVGIEATQSALRRCVVGGGSGLLVHAVVETESGQAVGWKSGGMVASKSVSDWSAVTRWRKYRFANEGEATGLPR